MGDDGGGQSKGRGQPVSAAFKGFRHASTLLSPAHPAVRRALGNGPTLLPLLPVGTVETLLEELRALFSIPEVNAAWICLPRPAKGGIVQYEPEDVIKLREGFQAAREAFPDQWLGISLPSKAGLYYRDVFPDFPGANGFWMEATKFADGPSSLDGKRFDLSASSIRPMFPPFKSMDDESHERQYNNGGDAAEGVVTPSTTARHREEESLGESSCTPLAIPSTPFPSSSSSPPPNEEAELPNASPLLFGGLMLNVSYTMRDESGTMTKDGRRKIATLISDVAHLCDVPCITVKHCSSQEIATIALIITPLAVFDDSGTPASLSFFRAKEVLIIVSEGLYSHSPVGQKLLDLRKVQALLHALKPPLRPPELPLTTTGVPPVATGVYQDLVRRQQQAEGESQQGASSQTGMSLIYDSGSFKVFLGGGQAITIDNKEQLVAHNVKSIVNCAPGAGLTNPLAGDPSVTYVELDVDEDSTDEFRSSPLHQWPAIMRFMHHAMKQHVEGTSLLIHCQAGRNRSVTTVAIWMVLEGLSPTLEAAMAWIRSCHSRADPDVQYVKWAEAFIPSYRQNFREWVKFLAAGRLPNAHFNLVYADASSDFQVFLGDFEAYIHTDWLINENVKYIVNCCASDGLGNALPEHPDINYIELTSDDMSHEINGKTDPRSQWPDIMQLMHTAKTKPGSGNLFIHCLQGKNRSVATLAVWLTVESICKDVDAAVAWIRSARPTVHPQVRYMQWAREFAQHYKLQQQEEPPSSSSAVPPSLP